MIECEKYYEQWKVEILYWKKYIFSSSYYKIFYNVLQILNGYFLYNYIQ
jgi:hypothetical protein